MKARHGAAVGLLAFLLAGCGKDIYFGGNASTAGCAGNKGPMPVRLEGYCIDSTEVSEGQYAEFLADAPALDSQPSECAWNQLFDPQMADSDVARPLDPERADYPINEVDFCDALAYCAWAGKRLCGQAGGGSLPLGDAALAGESEWFQACSADGAHTYPYGDDFDQSACAVTAGQHPVGTRASCEGARPGVFDMIGNVWEWEDSCYDDPGRAPEEVICSRRGGATLVDPPTWSCADRGDPSARRTRQTDMGIRCCSDLVP